MYSATFNISMQKFGATPTGTFEEVRDTVWKEYMILAGFASFVVAYPRRAKRKHNSKAHAEQSVRTVRGYYEHMNGHAPAVGYGINFTRTLRGVTRGLKKLYPTTLIIGIPLRRSSAIL